MTRPSTFTLNAGNSLSTGLLAAYFGNNAASNGAVDSSPLAGSASGTFSWSSDATLGRKVMNFSGTNFATLASLISVADYHAWSVTYWLYLTSVKSNIVGTFGHGFASGLYCRYLIVATNIHDFYNDPNQGTSWSSPVGNTTRYHVALVANASHNVALYINGSLVATNAMGNSTALAIACFANLGTSNTDYSLQGWMADFCVWNRALTTGAGSELAALANASDPTIGGWVRTFNPACARNHSLAL